jgi:hypothetical protein
MLREIVKQRNMGSRNVKCIHIFHYFPISLFLYFPISSFIIRIFEKTLWLYERIRKTQQLVDQPFYP